MLCEIHILQHYIHKIHTAVWAARYNLTNFSSNFSYFSFHFCFIVKAMWDSMVSLVFAVYIIQFFLACFESLCVCVSALFKDLTSSGFQRKRIVYRNSHQHVCVLFFLVAHASSTFSSVFRKSETPNIGQSFCMENVACLRVKVQWISFLCMHSFAVTITSGPLFSS